MKKCIIIPDSFKGTISSTEICNIIKEKLLYYYPHFNVITIPIADGGEGTVDSFLAIVKGKRVKVTASGPYKEKILCDYARFGETAVIEMAQAAGFTLVKGKENPAETTTYGVGELIRHAIENGCKEIIIGLGGSCTNDGGTGMAAALGVRFIDDKGEEFIPTGGTLDKIMRIDASPAKEVLRGCRITAMCDIDNPMYGENGAAYVFAPQKGADEKMVRMLDRNLRILSDLIIRDIGKDVSQLPGAGAAGAMGAGVAAFLNGELKSGIQILLDLIRFEEMLEDADLVFTGEGKIDGQSLRGKVVVGVAERASKFGVPVVAIVGDVSDDAYAAYDKGVTAIFSINRLAIPYEQAKFRSKHDLAATVNDIIRFLKYCGRCG